MFIMSALLLTIVVGWFADGINVEDGEKGAKVQNSIALAYLIEVRCEQKCTWRNFTLPAIIQTIFLDAKRSLGCNTGGSCAEFSQYADYIRRFGIYTCGVGAYQYFQAICGRSIAHCHPPRRSDYAAYPSPRFFRTEAFDWTYPIWSFLGGRHFALIPTAACVEKYLGAEWANVAAPPNSVTAVYRYRRWLQEEG